MKNTFKRLCSCLLSVIMVVCLIPKMETPVSAETDYDRGYVGGMAGDGVIYAHGLDVSAWQESGSDFQNFANAGYDYVILRCGTSYGKDKCFDEYYASAKAVGLDVGCYYYSYATSVSAAKTDAQNMLSWMSGKVFEYPVYFDYEDSSQSNIGGSDAATICLTFMDMLKAEGYLVGLYSMSSWLNQSWVTTSGIRSTYEGWVAHLPSTANNTGITSDLYLKLHSTYSKKYGMHQYSFTTYVNGQGPFDANVCYKDHPEIVKTFGFNGYQATETWGEKACFDVMVYRDRNADLAGMSDADLKKHWKEHGIKEGRPSSTVLDLAFFRNNNPDLKEAFGDDWEAIYDHFITKGYQEHRKSSALFDGRYYCNKYPDVAENYKEQYLLHYIDHGMAEGRRASLTNHPDYYWFIRPDVAETWPDDYKMAAKHYAGHGINAQIEAYDNKAPVISDVVISDVSADGYRYKSTTPSGQSYYTVTEIRTIEVAPEITFELISGSELTLGSSYLTKVTDEYTVADVKGQFKFPVTVLDLNGNAMDDAAIVTTGVTVCLTNDPTQKAIIVLKGDANGDGYIDSTDYLRIKSHFLERMELTGAFLQAADCDEDGKITSTDYLQLKSYFLGTYDLFP